jgi:hypothetical protein
MAGGKRRTAPGVTIVTDTGEYVFDRDLVLAHIKRSRAASGVPPTIEDPDAIERLARLINPDAVGGNASEANEAA